MWKYYALLSAFLASLAAIFAKIGVKDVNSDLATVTQFLSRRLWKPFHKTLDAIEAFRLESGTCPQLGDSNIIELNRLNRALERMMHGSLRSYQAQREFTENASHELQTPLAARVLGSGVVGEVFYGAVEINVHAMSLRGLSEQRK